MLTHVVHCGYRYLRMMDEHLGDSRVEKPVRVQLAKVSEYQLALEKLADDKRKGIRYESEYVRKKQGKSFGS